MRILHLISSNGLYGAEKVLLSLASSLEADGITSYVGAIKNLHHANLDIIAAAHDKGIPFYVIESKGRFDIASISDLRQFIETRKIDLIHTHNYKSNMIGLIAARMAKIPVVATVHGYIGKGLKLRMYERLDRFMLKFFDRVIFVDESLQRFFRHNPRNVSVIHNGVSI